MSGLDRGCPRRIGKAMWQRLHLGREGIAARRLPPGLPRPWYEPDGLRTDDDRRRSRAGRWPQCQEPSRPWLLLLWPR